MSRRMTRAESHFVLLIVPSQSANGQIIQQVITTANLYLPPRILRCFHSVKLDHQYSTGIPRELSGKEMMFLLKNESPLQLKSLFRGLLSRYYVTVARAARQRRAVKHILCDTGREGESRHDHPRNFH